MESSAIPLQNDATACVRSYGSPRLGSRYALPLAMLPEPVSPASSVLKEGGSSSKVPLMPPPPHKVKHRHQASQHQDKPNCSPLSIDPYGSPTSDTWGSPVSPRSCSPGLSASSDVSPQHPLASSEGSGGLGFEQVDGSISGSGASGTHRSPVRDLIAQFEAVSGTSVGGAITRAIQIPEDDEELESHHSRLAELQQGDFEQQLVTREDSARSDGSCLDLVALLGAMGAEAVSETSEEGVEGVSFKDGPSAYGLEAELRLAPGKESRSGNRSRLAVSSSAWGQSLDPGMETLPTPAGGIEGYTPYPTEEDEAQYDEMAASENKETLHLKQR